MNLRALAIGLLAGQLWAVAQPAPAKAKPRPAAAKPAAAKPVAKAPAIAKPVAEQPPAPGEIREFPVAAIKLEGNNTYTAEQILAVAQLGVGAMANKPTFEAARDRLLATGAFDRVDYIYFTASDGKSYDATFTVVEATPFYPFRLEELPAGVEAYLKSKDPLFGPKIPATKEKVAVWTKLIQEKAGVPVVGKVDADSPNNLYVMFRPAGSAPSVAEIKFTGNSVIPSAALRNSINGVAIGTIYNETHFRQLLATAIKPMYEERGRLRVTFPKVTTERSRDVNGLNVLVTVDEGESFMLGDIRIQGRQLPEADLMRAADFRQGDIANMTAVAEGVERMRNVLRRLGYIGAVATPDRLVNDQKKVIDLVIDIDQGDQFMMRALKVEGLDIESEPVIRKMWGLKEGKPFNPEYPDVFLNRVRADQVFEELGETRSGVTIDRAAKTVDVTLFFGRAAKSKSVLKSAKP